MGMVYQWKPGSRVSVDAQVAGERMEKIRARKGGLTPAAVVQDARSDRSPLHHEFEWDDRRAAAMQRLSRAGELIRYIAVTVRGESGAEPVTTRAFVSVRENEHQHFTSVSVAMSDPLLRDQVLARALGELRAFQAKYRDLAELAPVFEALEQMQVAA